MTFGPVFCLTVADHGIQNIFQFSFDLCVKPRSERRCLHAHLEDSIWVPHEEVAQCSPRMPVGEAAPRSFQ